MDLAETKEQFLSFSELSTHGIPQLYRTFSRHIAENPRLLAIAARAVPGQPRPNMLFAAVHDLLLSGNNHPLGDYYASLVQSPRPIDDAVEEIFTTFCIQYASQLLNRIENRRTQTNEIGRSALLLPAFCHAAHLYPAADFNQIEIGCSAGLNLNWPYYGYDYGPAGFFPPEGNGPTLKTELLGENRPEMIAPENLAQRVAMRSGIEVYPLNIHQSADLRWLKALTWPDRTDRIKNLDQAARIAARHPLTIHTGDAVAALPDLLAETPPDVIPLIYHSFALYQFSDLARQQISRILADASGKRPVLVVSLEWSGQEAPLLTFERIIAGRRSATGLAHCHPHGTWMRWL